MFSFLHAADLHLDSPLRGLERYPGAPVDEIRGATRRALENLVQLALEEKVDFVLIAGDVYDGDWKFFDTGLFFHHQMSLLRAADVPVFLVRGNHDALSEITKHLRLPEKVYDLDCAGVETHRELEKIGVMIHGRGFEKRGAPDGFLKEYPRPVSGMFNIGMLHTSAEGSGDHNPYAPCQVRDLVGFHYDYWALGHIHKRQVLHTSPLVVFPGNIQGRHAKETGPKGATLVKVDGKKVTEDHRVLDVVRWAWESIPLADCRTQDDALSRVSDLSGRLLQDAGDRLVALRLEFTGQTELHSELSSDPDGFTAAVRSLLTDEGRGQFWLEKALIETRAPIDFDSLRGRDDPPGYLVDLLRRLPEDADACRELAGQLRELKLKLPPELQYLHGAPLDSPETVLALTADVEQILLPRLLGA